MKFHKTGHKKAHKKAPAQKPKAQRKVRHNPAPSKQRRHYGKRRVRRNPSGLDLKTFGVQVAGVGAGALGAVYLNNLAAKWLPARFRGVASIAAGAAVVMFAGRNEHAERVALGAAGMGLLDILRNNVPALVPLSAEDAGYLLGAASAHDAGIAAVLGFDTGAVPMGVDNANMPDVLGVDNTDVPDVLGMGFDTGEIPMGDEEADGLFDDDEGDGL